MCWSVVFIATSVKGVINIAQWKIFLEKPAIARWKLFRRMFRLLRLNDNNTRIILQISGCDSNMNGKSKLVMHYRFLMGLLESPQWQSVTFSFEQLEWTAPHDGNYFENKIRLFKMLSESSLASNCSVEITT